MQFVIRDDINYIETQRNGFDMVSIPDNPAMFHKINVGKVCNILRFNKDEKTYDIKTYDGMYETVPEICLREVN